jgi:hypothetical protein
LYVAIINMHPAVVERLLEKGAYLEANTMVRL